MGLMAGWQGKRDDYLGLRVLRQTHIHSSGTRIHWHTQSNCTVNPACNFIICVILFPSISTRRIMSRVSFASIIDTLGTGNIKGAHCMYVHICALSGCPCGVNGLSGYISGFYENVCAWFIFMGQTGCLGRAMGSAYIYIYILTSGRWLYLCGLVRIADNAYVSLLLDILFGFKPGSTLFFNYWTHRNFSWTLCVGVIIWSSYVEGQHVRMHTDCIHFGSVFLFKLVICIQFHLQIANSFN